MFDPASLTPIVSGCPTVRDKLGTLMQGVIGQLRDRADDPSVLRYLRDLEAQIPALQDLFDSGVAGRPGAAAQTIPAGGDGGVSFTQELQPLETTEAQAIPEGAGAAQPQPDPLDHDGDGKMGGSLAGEDSTVARGRRNREASGK